MNQLHPGDSAQLMHQRDLVLSREGSGYDFDFGCTESVVAESKKANECANESISMRIGCQEIFFLAALPSCNLG